jgi:hypothetical protein
MHGGEQAAAEHTGHTQHVEREHQEIGLSLEYQHEVEGTARKKSGGRDERLPCSSLDIRLDN